MLSDLAASVEAGVSLADYTSLGLIAPALSRSDTAGVIHELSLMLQQEGCVPDVLTFYHSALNQELLESSLLEECGVAMPHARLGGVKRLRFALGRVAEPVPWNSRKSRPAELVFLLAVPPTDAAANLQLRSSLAWLCGQPRLLEELRRGPGPEAMLGVLRKVGVQV